MSVRIPNVPNVAHNLPIGSNLGSLGGWTLGSTTVKGGEIDGHTQGFKKPPAPRRLVGESQLPPGLSPTYTGTSK